MFLKNWFYYLREELPRVRLQHSSCTCLKNVIRTFLEKFALQYFAIFSIKLQIHDKICLQRAITEKSKNGWKTLDYLLKCKLCPFFQFGSLSLSNSGCPPEVAIKGQKEEIYISKWENKFLFFFRYKENNTIGNMFPQFHSINCFPYFLFPSPFKQGNSVISIFSINSQSAKSKNVRNGYQKTRKTLRTT